MRPSARLCRQPLRRSPRLHRKRVGTLATVALATTVLAPSVAHAGDAETSNEAATWQVTDFPTPFGGLSSIATNGDATVAVGFGIAPPFRFTPLAAAWDGDTWTRQRVRLGPDATDIQLTDVDLLSPTRGWTVGRGFGGSGSVAITARWNGTKWRGVPTDGLSGDIGFAGVEAIGRKNVWAVGQEQVGATLRSTIAHYDGDAWTSVDVPPLEGVGDFTALSSITRDAVGTLWAVGIGGVALRYEGSAWEQVDVPQIGGEYVDLQKVRSFGDAGVWAVGYVRADDGRHPVALRWKGSAWDIVEVPAGAHAQLNDVSNTASGVVAIGYSEEGALAFYGLRLDPNGPAKPLKLPEGHDALFGSTTNEAGTELWVVGSGAVGSEGKIEPYAAHRT